MAKNLNIIPITPKISNTIEGKNTKGSSVYSRAITQDSILNPQRNINW